MKKKIRKCHCVCHNFQKPPYYSDRCAAYCKHCGMPEGGKRK
jgi:hypothetical protein